MNSAMKMHTKTSLCRYYICLLFTEQKYFFCLEVELLRAQPCWFTLFPRREEKAWLMTSCTRLPHVPILHTSATHANLAHVCHTCQSCTRLPHMPILHASATHANLAHVFHTCQSCTRLPHMPILHTSATHANLALELRDYQTQNGSTQDSWLCFSHFEMFIS